MESCSVALPTPLFLNILNKDTSYLPPSLNSAGPKDIQEKKYQGLDEYDKWGKKQVPKFCPLHFFSTFCLQRKCPLSVMNYEFVDLEKGRPDEGVTVFILRSYLSRKFISLHSSIGKFEHIHILFFSRICGVVFRWKHSEWNIFFCCYMQPAFQL